MIVVADTSVVGYLILIGQSHLLPQLFSSIVIPEEVRAELAHPSAADDIRAWISAPPSWLRVEPVQPQPADAELTRLHRGEESANRRLVDLPSALEALSHTSFRAAPRLLRSLLEDNPAP
jgi:predicted nucleic acid-binding protein